MSEWKLYERLVAKVIHEQLSTDYCVTANAKVMGRLSLRKRQIDVLIDARHTTENKNRIIVDAKIKSRKVDVTHVEAFIGLMDDVEATHGYLVCPKGFTKSALKRAQSSVSLRLLPLDHLEYFDPSTWPTCHSTKCKAGHIFWDGYPSLELKLAPIGGGSTINKDFVHYTGKCDKCCQFHIHCLTCMKIFDIPLRNSNIGERCDCQGPWFWLASTEIDSKGRKSAELHLVNPLSSRKIETINRRSL